VLDKTGSLTDLHSAAQSWRILGFAGPWKEETLLRVALSLAQHSLHVQAQALVRLLSQSLQGTEPALAWHSVTEVPGAGLQACDSQGRVWRLGRQDWTLGANLPSSPSPLERGETCLACEGQVLLAFASGETLRPNAAAAIGALQSQGLSCSVLSGDHPCRVQAVLEQLPMLQGSQATGACRPEDKRRIVAERQAQGQAVAMLGDGLNDAPVLAQADASFSFADASGLSRTQADLVLLKPELSLLPRAHAQAQQTRKVMRQNFAWAAGYNALSVPLALIGLMPPWAAGLGMALSSLVVVLNAQRLQKVPPLA
jgi:P-type Cu2+ transporter